MYINKHLKRVLWEALCCMSQKHTQHTKAISSKIQMEVGNKTCETDLLQAITKLYLSTC